MMNLLFSCIGRRNYIVDYFRAHLGPKDRIIGTSNSKWTAGFQSCDLGIVLPNIKDPDYIPTVFNLCREYQIDAVLSFFDPDIDALSRHRKGLEEISVIPFLPTAQVSDICFDKWHTWLFLQEQGYGAPDTFLDLEAACRSLEAGRIKFPLMIKPRHGFGSRNLFVARNFTELETFFHYDRDMIIQETLHGQEYHLDICNDLSGEVLAVIPKRKVTMRAGETDQAEISGCRYLIDLGLRLGQALGELGHVGPLDVDLFVTQDEAKILEINPRFGGAYPVSHLAGADFPLLILRLIRGETVQPEIGRFQPGIIMMKTYRILGGRPSDLFQSTVDLSTDS